MTSLQARIAEVVGDADRATRVIEEALLPWLEEVRREVAVKWDEALQAFADRQSSASTEFMVGKVIGLKTTEDQHLRSVIERIAGDH